MTDDFLKSLQSSHKHDQASAALTNLATLTATYYRALRAEGFSALEAMPLVVSYQQVLLTTATNTQQEG